MEFMSALGQQESDAYRPSLFELIAQEKLRDLLQPAVQYAVAIYAQRYPRFLIRLVNNHEEFYALLMFLVERHYLKEWGGSFAENFYGLRRVPVPKSSPSHSSSFPSPANPSPSAGLSQKDINKSLLVLVVLPYLKCRLDLLYSQVSGGSSASLFGENEQVERETEELEDPVTKRRRKLAIRLIRIFRKVYPYINALYHGTNLIYNIAYLFGKTKYYTPWLHLLRQEVKRMSAADYRTYYDKSDASKMGLSLSSLWSQPIQSFTMVISKVIELLKIALPMSIFFFKFLEWWYSSEFSRRNISQTGENPIPPPGKVKPHPRGTRLPKKPNTCPLCLACPIVNPAALPTGYVFCYTCVYRYVESYGRCPVSWVKVERGTEDLTKIYDDASF